MEGIWFFLLLIFGIIFLKFFILYCLLLISFLKVIAKMNIIKSINKIIIDNYIIIKA